MLKILFLDTEEGSLYAFDGAIVDGYVALELVDHQGEPLDDYEEFALHEVGNALNAIADLVEACHES